MPQPHGTVRVARVQKVCALESCGSTFALTPHRAKKVRFCSKSCAAVYRNSLRKEPEGGYNWDVRARNYWNGRADRTDCDICGLPNLSRSTKRHHVDHCHTTGEFRGILCQGCNLHLGRWEALGPGIRRYLDAAVGVPIPTVEWRAFLRRYYREAGVEECQACGGRPKKNRLCVDHDHEHMVIRGILCIPCNVTEGWYRLHGPKIDAYLGGA